MFALFLVLLMIYYFLEWSLLVGSVATSAGYSAGWLLFKDVGVVSIVINVMMMMMINDKTTTTTTTQ